MEKQYTEQMQENSDKLNPFVTLSNIFTAPATAFEHIRAYPTWLFPFFLSLLMVAVFIVPTREIMTEFQKEAIYENTFIPEEYKDQAIEDMENKSATRFYIETIGGGTVSLAIGYLIAAGILMMVGNFFLGGQASFKQMFALFTWANIVGIVETLVKLALVLAKGTMHVYTSLAVLLDPGQHKTFLFQFLDAFELFTIWKIIVISIGFSVIYRFSRVKSYTSVILLYVIYLAIKIGFSQLF